MIMYDSIDISRIPSDAVAVAGYVNGSWPTFSSLASAFPRALKLSITVNADGKADCIDVEPGDASVASAAGWLRAAAARGVWRPCAYTSASSMGGLLTAVASAGLELSDFRFWSAHYGAGAHICGPGTCKLVNRVMDGTQWTDEALGRNLDQSVVDASFFPWYTALMTEIPVIELSSSGQAVKNWQSLLAAHGYSIVADGEFGLNTETVTKSFQGARKLTQDGVVGPNTWTAALTA
jgi:hypothetical protein